MSTAILTRPSISRASALALWALSGLACAQSPEAAPVLGAHPAVLVQARAAQIEADQFIVAPPVQVTWRAGHANSEHPAVQVARLAATSGIDANLYRVLPPATTTWALGPAVEPVILVAQRTR